MKIFYDCEFIEMGPSLPLELISIGMVHEDGRSLYLINADVSVSKLVRHPWLQLNVLPHLPIKLTGTHSGMLSGIVEWDTDHPDFGSVIGIDNIASFVQEFCLNGLPEGERLELWAYYGAYDHVVLSQMFGSMNELPQGMPMFTHDIMQEWDRIGRPDCLPANSDNEHRAIDDAWWNLRAFEAVQEWSARV
jgi:3' exoribonuclease, RNase T-like